MTVGSGIGSSVGVAKETTWGTWVTPSKWTEFESETVEWKPKRMVIVEFPSAEKAKAWWDSSEYAGLKDLRHSCSNGEIVLVDGV